MGNSSVTTCYFNHEVTQDLEDMAASDDVLLEKNPLLASDSFPMPDIRRMKRPHEKDLRTERDADAQMPDDFTGDVMVPQQIVALNGIWVDPRCGRHVATIEGDKLTWHVSALSHFKTRLFVRNESVQCDIKGIIHTASIKADVQIRWNPTGHVWQRYSCSDPSQRVRWPEDPVNELPKKGAAALDTQAETECENSAERTQSPSEGLSEDRGDGNRLASHPASPRRHKPQTPHDLVVLAGVWIEANSRDVVGIISGNILTWHTPDRNGAETVLFILGGKVTMNPDGARITATVDLQEGCCRILWSNGVVWQRHVDFTEPI